MTPERWRQITGVFHETLARDPAARDAFLVDACAGDRALRDEIESMLAAHASAGDGGAIPAIGVPSIDVPAALLPAGSAVGPYRVDRLIGAGGMGQVYSARDERIGRDVAIKVLPAECAADRERLRRFEQEARASGALNHPNVLTLYDIGTADGRPYLVMELLDGETLRDRLARGALAPNRSCEIAAAIARGLAAAHTKGIVHRDLKPENVMIARDGRVKVLDFGIAKLRARGAAPEAPTAEAAHRTGADVVLGTTAYMAPEQVRGRDVDERADLFALGIILFELLSGKRPFDRDSRADTMAAILNDDPPRLGLAAAAPALERIVQRCLEKDPDARFQSARDLAFALETSTAATPMAGGAPSSRRIDWRIAAAAAVVVIAVAIVWAWRVRPVSEPAAMQLARFTLSPPARTRFLGPPAISPDGTLVVFTAGEGPVAQRRLFIRRLDQVAAAPLPGTEGGNQPFFSPDGVSIGFWADDKLKTTRVDAATAPAVVCSVPLFLGGAWLTDGTIVFGSVNHGLQRVAAAGGEPRTLTTAGPGELDHHAPKMLPGGRTLLVTVHERGDRFHIDKLDLESGARRTIVAGGFDPVVSPSGYIVYVAERALFAARFDAVRAIVVGSAVKLLDGVGSFDAEGAGYFALSATGTMVMRPEPAPPRRAIVWADRTGAATEIPLEHRSYWTPRLSPDATRFAVVVDERGRRDIWIYRFDTKAFTPLTFEGDNWSPAWSPDGTRIAYLSRRDGARRLMSQPLDGNGGAETLLTSETDDLLPGAWSVDGQSLLFVDQPATSDSSLSVLPIRSRRAERLSAVPVRSNWPALSPDGRWVAFVMFPSGLTNRPSIYVTSFPGPGPIRPLVEAAGQPVWSRDGATLFYRSRRGDSSAVSGEGVFALPFDRVHGAVAGPERELFRKRFPDENPLWGVAGIDVAADGRFLIALADETEQQGGELNVLLHVDDELRRRVR